MLRKFDQKLMGKVEKGSEGMKEELKWKIFHWVERALVRLDLIGDKGEFNRQRKRKRR